MATGEIGEHHRPWQSRAAGVLATVGLVVTAALTITLTTAPAAAAAPSPGRAPAAVPTSAAHQPRLTMLVAMARTMTTMGIPYSHGGHGPHPAPIGASVDCSGLIRQLYFYAFGVDIGRGKGDWMVRTSGLFARTSHPVPGDVILIGHGGHAPAYHAMIYVGNDDGHPTGVGSPDFGYTVEYQHPWTRYWAGDVMGYWHYKGATKADSGPLTVNVDVTRRSQVGPRITLHGEAHDPMAPSKPIRVALYRSGRLSTATHTKDGRFTLVFRAEGGGHDARVVAYPPPGSESASSSISSCAPFPDVAPTNQHCWNITWLADRGITKPSDGRYHPAGSITRGAMAAFLFRIVHPERPSPHCTARPFPDVPTSSTFCGYIAWAQDHGVAHGYPDGRYRPASAVTRGAMAAFLHRIATDDAAPACHGKPFTDVPVDSTFCAVIAWAKDRGITYGIGDHRYGTAEPVSRQSMASFLRRIAKLV